MKLWKKNKLLISNKQEHEVKERINKFYSTDNKTKVEDIKNKIFS